MVEAILVDFSNFVFHSPNDRTQEWLSNAMEIIKAHSKIKCPYVFVFYLERDTNNINKDIQSILLNLSEQIPVPKENIDVLVYPSMAAILYNVKQKIDKLNLSTINVIMPVNKKAMMDVYINQLFTAVYEFTFERLATRNEGGIKLEASVPCTKDNNVLTDQHADEICKDIWTFLGQLKGLMGQIAILHSPLIPDVFLHGFTTRCGGISYIPSLSSLNLFSSFKRRDPKAVINENIRRLATTAGFNPKIYYLAKVNHGNTIWTMGRPEPANYDGIVTNQKGVTIAAPGADCIPLIFADPVQIACGAAHAGWRGTLAGVAIATVNTMMTEFACSMKDIRVVMGPCVGECCFTLHQEAAEEFIKIDSSCVRNTDGSKPHVNLRQATRVLLEREGILSENICDVSTFNPSNKGTLCTACQPDMFFSHTRDGQNFGTQIGFISVRD
ncbi:purine nucleoside phosphorylase LACC1 [Callorhinchus milii]|nr:purine nucleoside phosphorylase LACC1 [Callorhinchus milii]